MRARVSQPWVIRRGIYLVVSVAALAMFIAGRIDQSTAESWVQQADSFIPLITSLVTGLAAAKTSERSDPPREQRTVPVADIIDRIRREVEARRTPKDQ